MVKRQSTPRRMLYKLLPTCQLANEYQHTKNDRLRCLINHLDRFSACVDYGYCRKLGWPVGSGEVESANRYIPQERMKIPGATWHPDHLNPMLALRVVRGPAIGGTSSGNGKAITCVFRYRKQHDLLVCIAPLHDERRQHQSTASDIGIFRYKDDCEVCQVQ